MNSFVLGYQYDFLRRLLNVQKPTLFSISELEVLILLLCTFEELCKIDSYYFIYQVSIVL